MTRAGADDVVLLTGYPAFAARKMCETIVGTDPRAFVHAVVHPKLAAEAIEARDALDAEQRVRVNLLEGDAAAMDFGLSGAELRAIAPEIDRIHHMARVSYLGADKKVVDAVNVGGAREAVEVALACPSLKALVFHSSAAVSGDRTGLVLDVDLDKGQSFRNDVEESLAQAERVMGEARSRLPVVVLRPTTIVGDSRTGEVDRFDGPYFLILLVVTSPPDFPLPLPGRGDSFLHLVPIDYVVRAACAIGKDPRAIGRTFHIGDEAPLTARRVFELVAAAGGRRNPRGYIPANLTKALLRTPGLERIAKSPRAFMESLATPVTYSYAGASELLADTDVRCPPLESYVERLVEYVQGRLRERRAAREAEVDDPLV